MRTAQIVFALTASLAFLVPAFAEKAQPASPLCQATLTMDANSGEIVSEMNAHAALGPASMIKLMVAYVTMKRVKEGVLNLSDVVTTSAFASKIGGSQVYLKQGEQFTVQELMEALMIQSANDAAMALAEHIGGSSSGFVEMMNQEAQQLGLKYSMFYSPHGLPPGKGQQADVMSAYDLALLGRAIVREFPQLLEYTKTIEKPFRGGEFIMRNHNKLLIHYQGCDGLKTGYYAQAGFGITATALRNNVRVIAVLMGCADRKKRDQETARLLSAGFAQYKAVKLVAKGVAVPQTVAIEQGKKRQVAPVTADDLTGTVKISMKDKIVQEPQVCSALTAPVAAGTPCGALVFKAGDTEVGRVALVIPEDIPAGSLLDRFWPMSK